MLVIGCGTGRCGTQSLANLFAMQDGFRTYHELYLGGKKIGTTKSLRYLSSMNYSSYNKNDFLDKFSNIREDYKDKLFFDIGPYYIDIIDEIVHFNDVKIISIQRDKELCTKSIMEKYCNSAYHGFFRSERFKNLLGYRLPEPDNCSIKDFELFYDNFYNKLQYDKVLHLNTEELNDHKIAEKLSSFINYEFKYKKWNIK